jgi:hypothetical protein
MASAAMLLVIAAGCGVVVSAGPQAGPGNGNGNGVAPPYDTLTADLVVRHGRIDAAGAALKVSAPPMTLGFERRDTRGRWRTTLTLKEIEGARIESLKGPHLLTNPFAVVRMEFDEADDAPRYYNAAGKLVAAVSDADRARLGLPASMRDSSWDPAALLARSPGGRGTNGPRTVASGLVLMDSDRAGRRAGLESRFGKAVGKVRGLDRFVGHEGDAVHEVLVRTDADLPVEVSVGHKGQLVSRAEFTYEERPGLGFLRRRMRAEQLIPRGDGARALTEVELLNITLTTRGDR